MNYLVWQSKSKIFQADIGMCQTYAFITNIGYNEGIVKLDATS